MSSRPSPPPKDAPLIIVGAGVFGLSLAYELTAIRGYTNVTVLDRYLPPVPDGSSVDVSRIIRSEYADPLYAKLAVEALNEWRTPNWASQYHESGFVMLASEKNSVYMDKYREMREKQQVKQPMDLFGSHEAEAKIKELYPSVQANLEGKMATRNPVGGWAHASQAIEGLAKRCTLAGVSFITGRHGTVISLERSGGRVTGVRTAVGTSLPSSTVILATGAWSNFLMPDLRLEAIATGQPVGFIQLSESEAERLRDMPVMIDYESGVFCFPPTPETHQLKLARHGFGYTSPRQAGNGREVSSPNLHGNNAKNGYLPEDAERGLREGAKMFFPEFGHRKWVQLRMCWYTDTPTGDFVADHHPSIEGLFIATGGSGHAFKFLPVIGRHVADCFERTAAPELRDKWRIRTTTDGNEKAMSGDGSRGGPAMRKLTRKEQAKL